MTGRATFATDTLELVREQLRCGFLTLAGIYATRDAVAEQVDDLPDHLAGEANWVIDQLDAELAVRALDPGGCS